ncbi:MAG: IPT/TIG domain-containing protein [Deltaproteobacteria bacterium]|nr:IPT/TIG domain-containing protein [Deltaproteobacteria bacterium]
MASRPRIVIVLALITALPACFRTLSDIPEPGDGVTLVGTVVERELPSGIMVPVVGARISVLGVSDSAITDPLGLFQLSRLPLGALRVVIERPDSEGGGPRIARLLSSVQALVDGQLIPLGQIELGGHGDLQGSVALDDDTALGGAEGALVVLAETAFRGVVDREGRYLLPRLPEGRFDLAVFRAGYAPGRLQGVEVTAGEVRTLSTIVLPRADDAPPVTVRGRATLLGQTDSTGISVGFASESSSTTAAIAPVETDAAGSYAVTLPLGVYSARFEREGYRPVRLLGVVVLPQGVVGLLPVQLVAADSGDLDGDGIVDGDDGDRDNDGCPNTLDDAPDDPLRCRDLDGDGTDDSLDSDDDGDGLLDAEELSPGLDGVLSDPRLADTDRDGFDDGVDLCPAIADPEQADRDADGIGDACDQEPTILGFFPGEAAPGTFIQIQGRRFFTADPRFNVVRFGGGGVSFATVASATRLSVMVPFNGQSGRLTLDNPFGTATSSDTFTFLPAAPPPQIFDVIPRRFFPGAQLIVEGAALAGATIKVGGIDAAVSPLDPTPPPRSWERIAVTTSPALPRGPVLLEARNGSGSTTFDLEVIDAPSIFAVTPNPAGVGQRILISGTGFDAAGQEDQITVQFNGVAPVTPFSVASGAILVDVPVGATTGPLIVHHPGGDATFPSLAIDPGLPVILAVDPYLAEVGTSIDLIGRNLDAVTRITIAGQDAAITARTPAQLTVTVPAAAAPGPIIAESSFGSTPATDHLKILVREAARGVTGFVTGAFSEDGGLFFSIENGGRDGVTRDATTLAELTRRPLQLPAAGAIVTEMVLSPSRQVAVLGFTVGGSTMGTQLIDLPSFSPRFSCPSLPEEATGAGGGAAYVFSPDGQQIFGTRPRHLSSAQRDGIWFADVSRETCGVLAEQARTGNGLLAVLPTDRSHQLLVVHLQRGLAFVDIDPRSPGFGTMGPFRAGPGSFTEQLSWAPGAEGADGADFWRFAPGAVSERYSLAGRLPLVVGGSLASTSAQFAVSADRRWAAYALNSGGRLALVDLERARVAARGGTSSGRCAAHPIGLTFIATESTSLQRFTILE